MSRSIAPRKSREESAIPYVRQKERAGCNDHKNDEPVLTRNGRATNKLQPYARKP